MTKRKRLRIFGLKFALLKLIANKVEGQMTELKTTNAELTLALNRAIDNKQVHCKFDPASNGATKAYVHIDFGCLMMSGFRIMQSKFENSREDNLNLVPPSIPNSKSNRRKVVFFYDMNLWQKLETTAIEQYQVFTSQLVTGSPY